MKRGGHDVSLKFSPKAQNDNRKFYCKEVKPLISGYIPDFVNSKTKKKRRRIGMLQRIARAIGR